MRHQETRPAVRRVIVARILALGAALPFAGCERYFIPRPAEAPLERLVEVASFPHPHQVTGLAVDAGGRLFVCSPYWHDDHAWHVAEVVDGVARPYPSEAWNTWTLDTGSPAPTQWVTVQALYIDALNRLWALDPGSPKLAGVVPGGAKLVQFDLSMNRPERTYLFDESAAPARSYLNDVRIDVERNVAFITDSGLGAIVVVDLATGDTRRLLEDDPSTKAEPGFVPIVGARPLVTATGEPLVVHSDGIALDERGGWLYWQALTGRTLFRAPVAALLDESLSESQLVNEVQSLGLSPVTDGMACDEAGLVYFTALERDAIIRRTPLDAFQVLAAGPVISWPDSFAWGPDGWLYFTTAQIHRTAWFNADGAQPTEPYRVFKLLPPPLE